MSSERSYSIESHERIKLILIFGDKSLLLIWWVTYSFIHSFTLTISIAPLQVLYYSEALPTTPRILYRSFTPKRETPIAYDCNLLLLLLYYYLLLYY